MQNTTTRSLPAPRSPQVMIVHADFEAEQYVKGDWLPVILREGWLLEVRSHYDMEANVIFCIAIGMTGRAGWFRFTLENSDSLSYV